MIDIIDGPCPLAQVEEIADDGDDIGVNQRPMLCRCRGQSKLFEGFLQFIVQLPAPDFRKIVAFRVEKEVFEEGFGGLFGGGISRTQSAVNLEQRLILGAGFIARHCIPHTCVQARIFHVQDGKRRDPLQAHLIEQVGGHLVIQRGHYLPCPFVDDILRQMLPQQLVGHDGNFLETG